MRNLKRALSLAMACVMTLGMMTVGTSAKGIADFSDAAEIVNADAVAVTSELGIFVGYDDGEFKGDEIVTRAQMAVICAKMLYGADVDPSQFQGINKFTDVPAWAEGWVNLCASLGIIVGRDEKTFDPDATVSTVEASVMLAKTLGYFKNQKDFGSDWKLATTAKATQLGLYGDLKLAADAGLTRDSVAELVFNTLTKAVPVDYNELLGVYYNQNQGIVYALEFNYLQTLGYKNFDLVYKTTEDTVYGRPAITWGTGSYDYKKDTVTVTGTENLDSNGGLLNDNVIMLDRDEIITIPDTADYTYTKGVKAEDIYKALGKSVCETYDWDFYVNGKKVGEVVYDEDKEEFVADIDKGYAGRPTDKDEDYTYTSKGAVTEIYIDKAEQKVTLCEINYYLGEVSSVKDDDDGVYANIRALSEGGKILDDKKFYTDELAADDMVVFTVDHKDKEYYIPEGGLFTPATATGEVTRVQDKDNSTKTYIRLDGEATKYEYASAPEHMVYDLADAGKKYHPELAEDYILYMTPAGYVLGFEKVDDTVDQYLYVKDSDEELKDWIAKIVLTDATSAKVDVKSVVKGAPEDFCTKDNSDGDEVIEWKTGYNGTNSKLDSNIDGKIFKYSVNDKGVYSLTWVKAEYPGKDMKYNIHKDEAYIGLTDDTTADEAENWDVMVNSKTIFVDVNGGKSYVGHKNVPNIENAEIAYATDSKGVAKVVFILSGEIYDKDATYFFVADTDRESLKHDGKKYFEYTDIYNADGKQITLTIAYDALGDQDGDGKDDELQAGHIYQIKKVVDEIYATKVVEHDCEDAMCGDVVAAGGDTFRIVNASTNNKHKFDTEDETKMVLVEYKGGDYDVSVGDVDDMIVGHDDEGFTSFVHVLKRDDQTAELVFIHNANESVVAPVLVKNGSYVTNVEIAGLNDNMGATVGDELTLKMGLNGIVKAYGVKDNEYNVVINGKTYTGYGIDGKLYVQITVLPTMLNADGEVVLTFGNVVETETAVAEATKDTLKKVTGFVGAVEVAKEKTVRLYVATKYDADKGYYYSVNNDTVKAGQDETHIILKDVDELDLKDKTLEIYVDGNKKKYTVDKETGNYKIKK